MPQDSYQYPVTVRWISGKEGVCESADGFEPLPIAAPPEFGGPKGEWTPEHMLVAATATCLMTTFLAAAEASQLRVLSYEAPATGLLERADDRRYWFPRIEVRPRVRVANDADRERALRLLQKAEAACLISRSLRSSVVVTPVISVESWEPALV